MSPRQRREDRASVVKTECEQRLAQRVLQWRFHAMICVSRGIQQFAARSALQWLRAVRLDQRHTLTIDDAGVGVFQH